jgi:multiple sugar transport system ATP-binding protein
MLGLAELLKRKPAELSGGQRQRVAVGRAIVRDPAVFLFDEPLSNLDAKLRAETRIELKKLHERLRATAVYVTHDQVEAMTLAGRVVVMEGGRVHQAGAPLEVYDRPADRFVAGFLGSPPMNFLRGELRAAAEGLAFGDGRNSVPLPAELVARLGGRVSGPVDLGIRPERVTLGPGPGPALRAAVSVVEPLGSELLVYLSAGEQRLVARVDSRTRAAAGEEVELHLLPEHLHLFDAAGGRNLTAGA